MRFLVNGFQAQNLQNKVYLGFLVVMVSYKWVGSLNSLSPKLTVSTSIVRRVRDIFREDKLLRGTQFKPIVDQSPTLARDRNER